MCIKSPILRHFSCRAMRVVMLVAYSAYWDLCGLGMGLAI